MPKGVWGSSVAWPPCSEGVWGSSVAWPPCSEGVWGSSVAWPPCSKKALDGGKNLRRRRQRGIVERFALRDEGHTLATCGAALGRKPEVDRDRRRAERARD